MFPASNPQYVLIVTLDEPVDTTMSETRRTAGWTAVPVAAEIIRRVAPLMGLRLANPRGGCGNCRQQLTGTKMTAGRRRARHGFLVWG